MKTTFLATLLSVLAINLTAANYQYGGASASGTNITSTVTFFPRPLDSTEPIKLISLDTTSDNGSSRVLFISPSSRRNITGSVTNAPLKFTVNSTNGVSGNVLIQRQGSTTTILGTVTNIAGGNVTLNVTNATPVASGDVLYILQTNSTPLGATTLRLTAEALFVSGGNDPFLIQVDGTNSCAVNGAVVKQ